MSKIIDLRSLTYDDEAIRELQRKWFGQMVRKYYSGRGIKSVIDNMKGTVNPNCYGASAGLTRNRKTDKWVFRNSVSFKGLDLEGEWGREDGDPWFMWEYAHIRNDSEIGAAYLSHPDGYIKGVIAHEVAHSVHQVGQYCAGGVDNSHMGLPVLKFKQRYDLLPKGTGWECDGHGLCWQALYRELRVKHVNKYVITPEEAGVDTGAGKYKQVFKRAA